MDMLLANVSQLEFKLERELIEQVGAIALPFNGMDKSTAAVCQFLNSKNGIECDKGSRCPFRHIRGDRTIVCKHWLRGLCKKGDQCEFLHEYDMKKMPECYFYSRFNACHNKECPFLHIDPESKIKDCPWYDRGFCRHGPHCRHRHVRRVMCMNYLAGFCMNGWECKHMHPRFELPAITDTSKDQIVKKIPTCHYCGELGHKASVCRKLQENTEAGGNPNNIIKSNGYHHKPFGNYGGNQQQHQQHQANEFKDASSGGVEGEAGSENKGDSEHNNSTSNNNFKGAPYPRVAKPIEEITCFKCGNKGHYANKCPKGHLAFLSNQRSHK